MKLFNSYKMEVESAYIIRVAGNPVSEELALRCAQSCERIGQAYAYWPAYDGTGKEIIEPEGLKDHPTMNLIRVMDHYMTKSEVACALSHISLWAACVEQDQPIVILEHDAVMVKPYHEHAVYNSICYLGSTEQVHQGWQSMPTPPHATEGPNYHFLCRAHAYAIDPAVAKNLLAHVIKYGITAPLDIMIRADVFPIHQMGIFAYDSSAKTTISGRPTHGRTTERNDRLIN